LFEKYFQRTELGKVREGITIAGIFLLSFISVALSHAETLDSSLRPPEYFFSNLSQSTSLKKETRFLCGADCLSDEPILAKRTKRKPSARRISNSSDRRPDLELNSDYFLNIFSDTKYIFLSPLRWQARDWVKAGLVLGATGGLFLLDDEIRDFIQDERSTTTDDIASVFEPFGNGGYTFGGLVGFYLYGRVFENSKAERTALLAVESFAVTGIFTFALKFSTGRARPQSARDSGEWIGPNLDDVSFPSGHTSSAFSIATVLASEYKNNPWVPPVAYGLATLTGLSRLNDNKHWASDVFLGGALGYFIAKTVLKLHSNKKGRHYTIYPRLSRKEVGLDFAMRF
jgi:membrane-associated phospholipid phosphatase